MKSVAITRILDEVDIVESFVRHTAAFVQHHIFMDNGSRDGTIDILQKLAEEGLPITVYQNRSVSFSEQSFMTFLYQQAVEYHNANWVYCLDCDEFIDDRGLHGGLSGYLRNILADPSDQTHVRLRWVFYRYKPSDDTHEVLVPKRISHRDLIESEQKTIAVFDQMKIIINARVGIQGIIVDNGGHNILLNGAYPPDTRFVQGAWLAHYFARSAFHSLTKATRGWAKVRAAGFLFEERGTSLHYKSIFEYLRDQPHLLLRNEDFMNTRYEEDTLIHDPIDYKGGPLRYTPATEPAMQAVRAIVGYLDDLSGRHGQLVDDFPIVRRFVDDRNRSHTKIIGETDSVVENDKVDEVFEGEDRTVGSVSFVQKILHARNYAQIQFKKLRYAFSNNRPASSESRMPGFDEKYYLYWYRDVPQFTGNPLQHYLTRGWKEGRDPSSGFSTDGYLSTNPDVEASGLNPLLHFLKHGLVEGREGWQKDPRAPAPEPRYVHRVGDDQPR